MLFRSYDEMALFTLGFGFGTLLATGCMWLLQMYPRNLLGDGLPLVLSKPFMRADASLTRFDNHRCCLKCGRLHHVRVICGCGNDTVDGIHEYLE